MSGWRKRQIRDLEDADALQELAHQQELEHQQSLEQEQQTVDFTEDSE